TSPRHPTASRFPYTTLFRSRLHVPPELGPALPVELGEVAGAVPDRAGARAEQAEEGAGEGGLARAALPAQADAPAGAHGEADVVHDRRAAVAEGDPLGAQHRRLGCLVRTVHAGHACTSAECPGSRGTAAIRSLVYCSRGRANTPAAGPLSTTAPSFITTTRSAIEETSARSWETSRTARPRSSCSRRSTATTSACTVTSSALVGSSASSTSAPSARASAMANRCACPP